MQYLSVSALLESTGIKDKYGFGYVAASEFGVSDDLAQRLKFWVSKYDEAHYMGFKDERIIDNLDIEGLEIARAIKDELIDVKIEYFSEVTGRRYMV
jgi:hypothetical protein